MGVKEDFEIAAEEAKNFTKKPSNDEMLKLYALYKQGTAGDCNTGVQSHQTG
jgi:diazepam-binding inhibitor (GABA receptor modulator, acyl-CoA-binding protein)